MSSPALRRLRRRLIAVRVDLLALGLWLLALGFAVVGAAEPMPWLFGLGMIGWLVWDEVVYSRAMFIETAMSRGGLGVTARGAARDVLALVLLARYTSERSDALTFVAICTMGMLLVRVLHVLLSQRLSRLRRLPVITRNIDLDGLRISDPPPAWLYIGMNRRLTRLDVLLLLGAPLSVATDSVWPAVVGALLAAALTLAATLTLLPSLSRVAHLHPERVMAYVQAELDRIAPDVVLYHSGSDQSLYQLDMWLNAMEQSPRRVLVMMRERNLIAALGPTRLPVICIPSALDLMNLRLSTVRVSLFAANVGKNIHLLRVPGIRSVFIGHGDSDKVASFNPFTKVYDEVWVAGRAGRERYLRAMVGVNDAAIHEVGRPQLAELRTAGPRDPSAVRTVLYAPTWEGWTDDPFTSSLMSIGPTLVSAILAGGPEVRLIYKPHPFTGTRNPRALQAHRAVVELIEQANGKQADAQQAGPGRVDATATGPAPGGTRGRKAHADEASDSRDAGHPAPGTSATEQARLREHYQATWWASAAPTTHRVIDDPAITLYSCFNQADLMIADISSVVADFVQTQKPYAVTNGWNHPAEEFRELYPTAAAGYLIGRSCAEVPALLDLLRDPARDVMVAQRREVKARLLGPDQPSSMELFHAAVDRLAGEAARHPAFNGVEAGIDDEAAQALDANGERGVADQPGAADADLPSR